MRKETKSTQFAAIENAARILDQSGVTPLLPGCAGRPVLAGCALPPSRIVAGCAAPGLKPILAGCADGVVAPR